jgi:hypothetical protein
MSQFVASLRTVASMPTKGVFIPASRLAPETLAAAEAMVKAKLAATATAAAAAAAAASTSDDHGAASTVVNDADEDDACLICLNNDDLRPLRCEGMVVGAGVSRHNVCVGCWHTYEQDRARRRMPMLCPYCRMPCSLEGCDEDGMSLCFIYTPNAKPSLRMMQRRWTSNELQQAVEARGGRVAYAVGSGTDAVMYAGRGVDSQKARKARALGVPVVHKDGDQEDRGQEGSRVLQDARQRSAAVQGVRRLCALLGVPLRAVPVRGGRDEHLPAARGRELPQRRAATKDSGRPVRVLLRHARQCNVASCACKNGRVCRAGARHTAACRKLTAQRYKAAGFSVMRVRVIHDRLW